MEEQLITLKTAQLAKEKGFDFLYLYYDDNNITTLTNNSLISQSLLQRWLRKVHNIHIKIDDFIDDEEGIEWDYEVDYIGTDVELDGAYVPLISFDMTDDPMRKFLNYESALESALYESLELLNNE